MPRITPKAVFVGPESIGKKIASVMPEWDFVGIVENISTLYDKLASEEISTDLQVLLTLDYFFDPAADNVEFDNLIASNLSNLFIGVGQYRAEWAEQIKVRVANQAQAIGEEDAPFYFFPVKGFRNSLLQSVAEYIRTTDNDEVAAILAGRDVPTEHETEPVREMAPAHTQVDYANENTGDSPYYGKVVAVTSSKGGSGKSTVGLTLGTYIAHASESAYKQGLEDRPLKVIVVDLDVRDGQLGFLTGTKLIPNVMNMRMKGINEATLLETIQKRDKLKLDLLFTPRLPRVAQEVPAEFYLELIQFLRHYYDYIILDTSVNYLDPLLEQVAYPIADQIVFVTDIVVNSVFSMVRWINEVTGDPHNGGMGIPKRKVGIVVNKSIANVNMSGEKIQRNAMGIPVVTVIPNNAKLIAHAANLQSMEAILRHPDIKFAIRRLARAIVPPKKYQLSDDLDLSS